MISTAEDWTEKYRPKKLSEVIGNPSAVKELQDWAASWMKGVPKKRAVVLIGTPGIGKTSSAVALANDMGWDIIEMNASDQRTGSVIRDIALKGSHFNTLGMDEQYKRSSEGKKKLIVLDEADNLFGNADRGALPVISELIKTTKQPVILIVNDFFALSKKSSTVKTDTIQITFRKPVARSAANALKRIAASEGLSVDDAVLLKIAENSNGDMRAAVRDLEALAQGRRTIDIAATEVLEERIIRKDMYVVLEKMFRSNDPFGAYDLLKDVDIDPGTAMLWIDENLPYEYKEPGDAVRGYEKLSRADVFLGRVSRRQYFGLWSYASVMMTAGVSTAKFSNKVSHERLRFPLYLAKMSRSKTMRGLRLSVCLKIACSLHTSTKRVENDILGPLKILALNDPDIRLMLVKNMGFEPEELAFLLDSKIESKIVKDAFKFMPAGEMSAETAPEKIEPTERPVPKAVGKKNNLLDF